MSFEICKCKAPVFVNEGFCFLYRLIVLHGRER